MLILLNAGNTTPYVRQRIHLQRCSDFWGQLSLVAQNNTGTCSYG